MTDQNRITELESKIAFQERTIGDLNQLVYEQEARITRLEEACRELAGEIKAFSEKSGSGLPKDEKPPHY